ncbi:GSCFA domain-containing protein [Azotobacter chroococcum]|uniref:GSCFA domain-containing protein n=1 Tax=Azotobacter chroococcum TaxID=353 RepID=A0AAP9YEX3_9GAMM|nr:GSCFA domain-containing protein [Azotobacter chroococcum]QQE90047.1 GSCFA domain-containing protein [Azotobacter chroococcum]
MMEVAGRDIRVLLKYPSNASHSLHAIALAIADTFDYVDYFPSYEIIMNSERSKTVMDDGIHICAEPVENVIRQFKAAYLACPFAGTPSSLIKARELVFQKECVL